MSNGTSKRSAPKAKSQAEKMQSIVSNLPVAPSNLGARQLMDNTADAIHKIETNPKAHIFLAIEKLVNEFFELSPTPYEIEKFVAIVDKYISQEQKQKAISTLAEYSNCNSAEEAVVSALQRIQQANGKLKNSNRNSISIPLETPCNSVLTVISEYVDILNRFKKSPLTQNEIAYLLEIMKIVSPELASIPTAPLAFSVKDKLGIKSLDLFFLPTYLETAKLNFEILNDKKFPKLIYTCKLTLEKNNLEFVFFNTLWSDLNNILKIEEDSQFFTVFSRNRIEKAIVGNFGFLPISTHSPRVVEEKILDSLSNWNSTKKYSLFSGESKRRITVYEIGHILVRNLSSDKKYEPIHQYLIWDKSSNKLFIRYGSFSEKFASISNIYQIFVVDHFFSEKNLEKDNPYLGKVSSDINVPVHIEPEIFQVFKGLLPAPSVEIDYLADRIKEY